MDELEFRRRVYADPDSAEPEVLAAIREQPARQGFKKELQRLNDEIKQAACLPVPEDLADRLILRQSLSSHRQNQRRWRFAIAASLAVMLGLSVYLLPNEQHIIQIDKQILAHVHHSMAHEFLAQKHVSRAELNRKLARFDASITGDLPRVYSANDCTFNQIASLHLVMEGTNGRYSVFVVPKQEKQALANRFSDGNLSGQAIDMGGAHLIVIGARQQNVQAFQQVLQSRLRFSV